MVQSGTQNQSVSPTNGTVGNTVSGTPTDTVRDTVRDTVLEFCHEAHKAAEIMEHLGYSNKTKFLNRIIYPMIQSGLLKQVYPETPNHPNQKYQTVKRSRDE